MSDENLEFDRVSISKAMLFGALENREHKFTPDSFNLHNQHLHSSHTWKTWQFSMPRVPAQMTGFANVSCI